MKATRGQVKRALEWADWLTLPRHGRKGSPVCVTCGAKSDGEFGRGEPRFSCRHEPLRIDDAAFARALVEFSGLRRG